MTHLPRHARPLGLGLAGLALAALAIQIASRLVELGSAETDRAIADWTYRGLMVFSSLAVLARAALVPRQRLAWTMFGLGLAAWTIGDLYYFLVLSDRESIPYPSESDYLYLLVYVGFLAGLRLLGGRIRGARIFSLGLLVCVLGLATLWSWLVFGEVVTTVSGDTAAVATTLAYPLLDLVLIVAALFALGARNWRIDPVMLALGVGLVLMATGDSIYAAQTADGTYVDGTIVEVFWPVGAVAIAAAAWLDRGPAPRGTSGDRSGPVLAVAAVAVALAAQTFDHFTRIDTLTFVLSCLTLAAAVPQLVILYRDRAQARAAVAAAGALRSVSIDAALECIISIDAEGKVREWNDAARHTFGFRADYARGRDLAELIIPPEQRAAHRNGMARLMATGEARILNRRIELMALNAHGERFPVELTVTQVRQEPPMFTGFLRDISEHRRREEENSRLAAIVRSSEDAILSKNLSGVITAWNRGAELLYGYSAAEAVGHRLRDLIVPDERVGELKRVMETVLAGEPAAFETERVHKSGQTIHISLRAFPIRNLAGEVVGASTMAHDISERKRREERDRRDEEGRMWRARIETALEKGHFMFWGQPVIDARTGAVHHHELLLRMDLDGDVITPNHFLPHAENSELITEIDRWAIREGLTFARTMRVAINLSARSLEHAELISEIKAALTDSELARNVIFEITETAAVADLDAARDLVRDLVSLGCGVALDDFGTGYGSFTYLEHLPVTELKIDMSFVRALAADPNDQRLVRSMVAVAKNFSMKTVAEGVEDEVTAHVLRTLGVDLLQGYHLGYPAQMTSASRWPSSTQLAPGAASRSSAPI